MKPMKIGGACAVISVVVGMMLAASAHAEIEQADPPTFANPARTAQIAALTRIGISPERASRAVEVQGEIAEVGLIERMEALGGPFGGVWFKPAAATLHVGVTTAAGRRTAEAAIAEVGLTDEVTVTTVHSSWTDLIAAQRQWERRLGDLLDREEVKTSRSPEHNSVNIQLGSLVPDARRIALEREASKSDVNVSVSTGRSPKQRAAPQAGRCEEFVYESEAANCDPTLVSGVLIESEGTKVIQCTAGPLAISKDLTLETTNTFLLTAGHCINKAGGISQKWGAYNTKGVLKTIGSAATYLDQPSSTDIGVIRMQKVNPYWSNAGNPPVTPALALWSTTEATEPVEVPGEIAVGVGLVTCVSGAVSAFHCGVVKELGVTLGTLKELVEVEEAKTFQGDSGAPWFSGEAASENWMEGVHYGINVENFNPVFVPLKYAFAQLEKKPRFGLDLLRAENAVRPLCPMQP